MVDLSAGSRRDAPSATSAARLMEEDPALEVRYQEYRRRQARDLASALPREAIRPLHAKARRWASEIGLRAGGDPLATFTLFLETILPLPPFDVWAHDRAVHLAAHLQEEFGPPRIPTPGTPPVTVESRGVEMGGRRWRATLNVSRREEAWRGFIAFTPLEGNDPVKTGEIFREDDPEEIRERFRGYHVRTLRAFLRSVLP